MIEIILNRGKGVNKLVRWRSLYLVLLLLLLMTQCLLPLLLYPQLPRLLQHPLVVGH